MTTSQIQSLTDYGNRSATSPNTNYPTAQTTQYQQAFALDAAGVSYLPIRIDGTKRPLLNEWKHLEHTHPTTEEREGWFGNGKQRGIALICGEVSGNLELIDFDAPELIAEYDQRLEECAPGLLARLLIVKTPKGGRHLIYRCAEIAGNVKLAMRWQPATTEAKNAVKRAGQDGLWERVTLIETRGRGGYAVTVGSPARCHSLNKPYTLEQGNFANIPLITPDERALLHGLAAEFTEIEPAPERQTRTSDATSTRPGDLFNADPRAYDEVLAALQADGWVSVGRGAKGLLLRRPGKTEGNSATLYDNGCLWVFSTNVSAFDSETLYDPFGIVMRLQYGGDPIATAKALAAQGYAQPQSTAEPRKLTAKQRQDTWRAIESMARTIASKAGFSGESIETHFAIASLLYVPGEEQAAKGVASVAIAARLGCKTTDQQSLERTAQRRIKALLTEQARIGRALVKQTRIGKREKNLYWDYLIPLADAAHQDAIANMARLKAEGQKAHQVFDSYAQEAVAKLPLIVNTKAGAALIEEGNGTAETSTLPDLPGTSTMGLSDYAEDQRRRKLAGAEKICDGIIERGTASDDEWHGYGEAKAWLGDHIADLLKLKNRLAKLCSPAARKQAHRLVLATAQQETERWADETPDEPEAEKIGCVALNSKEKTHSYLGRHTGFDDDQHESPEGALKGDNLSPLDTAKPSKINDLIFQELKTESDKAAHEIEFFDMGGHFLTQSLRASEVVSMVAFIAGMEGKTFSNVPYVPTSQYGQVEEVYI